MNIDLKKYVDQYPCTGILHVGASTLQELPLYKSLGIENRVWIEGDKELAELAATQGEKCYNVYITSGSSQVIYTANNNGESSSLLKPKFHESKYPNIRFSESEITDGSSRTLEDFINSCHAKFNYLVLDIQGMELNAIKHLGVYKSYFDVIITEAYTEELYEGCGMLEDIKNHLEPYYKLVEFGEEIGKGWGDAVFVNKRLI